MGLVAKYEERLMVRGSAAREYRHIRTIYLDARGRQRDDIEIPTPRGPRRVTYLLDRASGQIVFLDRDSGAIHRLGDGAPATDAKDVSEQAPSTVATKPPAEGSPTHADLGTRVIE